MSRSPPRTSRQFRLAGAPEVAPDRGGHRRTARDPGGRDRGSTLAVPASLATTLVYDWLDVLAELLEFNPVTVVCLQQDRRETTRAVPLARQRLETPGIAVVALPGAPLARLSSPTRGVRRDEGPMRAEDLSRFLRQAPTGVVDVAVHEP